MPIPKIIHLVWLGELTGDVGLAVNRHRELNPQHEIRLHRNDRELNPAYRRLYDTYAKLPQLKSDLIRWSLLEKHGGWYFDVDCVPFVGVETIEEEYGLTGRRMFVTMRGIFINNDILAVAPGWAGWPEVHGYLESYRANGNKILYSCFSADVLWPRNFDQYEEKFLLGERERFSAEGDKTPFVLRGADVQRTQPGTKQRVSSYAKAVRRWIAAGRPSRSDDEVQRIYQQCCRPCPHFDAKKKTCKICGCRVRAGGRALTNKIKMATERCPEEKW